ncbi:hypothetical protein DFAR_570011 [Desulfarculales bacterium]
MWVVGNPPPCARPPAGRTHPRIRSYGPPSHRAPFWNSTGKSASSLRGRCQLFQARPHRIHQKTGPGVAQDRKKQPIFIISVKPPSSGFKSWPSCTSSLSFRETPSQSSPASWPASTTSPTSSYTELHLPLASKVVARSHLAGVSLQSMQAYLLHHLKIAGVKQNLFADPAITAI